jgi:hypothetical protein
LAKYAVFEQWNCNLNKFKRHRAIIIKNTKTMRVLIDSKERNLAEKEEWLREFPDKYLNEITAMRFHDQTLEKLNSRGGLSPIELVMNIKNMRWNDLMKTEINTESLAMAELKKILKEKESETEEMVSARTWQEFRETGLMLFVNSFLHIFGWALVFEIGDKNVVTSVYPARVKYRGFDNKSTEAAHKMLSTYVKQNIDELVKEAHS